MAPVRYWHAGRPRPLPRWQRSSEAERAAANTRPRSHGRRGICLAARPFHFLPAGSCPSLCQCASGDDGHVRENKRRQVPAPNARADQARVERDHHRVVPTGPATSTRIRRRLVIRNLKQKQQKLWMRSKSSAGCKFSGAVVRASLARGNCDKCCTPAWRPACLPGPRNHAQGRAGGLGVGDAAEHGRAVLARPSPGRLAAATILTRMAPPLPAADGRRQAAGAGHSGSRSGRPGLNMKLPKPA
jgi:hypothetical protein